MKFCGHRVFTAVCLRWHDILRQWLSRGCILWCEFTRLKFIDFFPKIRILNAIYFAFFAEFCLSLHKQGEKITRAGYYFQSIFKRINDFIKQLRQ